MIDESSYCNWNKSKRFWEMKEFVEPMPSIDLGHMKLAMAAEVAKPGYFIPHLLHFSYLEYTCKFFLWNFFFDLIAFSVFHEVLSVCPNTKYIHQNDSQLVHNVTPCWIFRKCAEQTTTSWQFNGNNRYDCIDLFYFNFFFVWYN